MTMTHAEIENTKRKLHGEYVPVSDEELSSNEVARWDNAAAEIAQVQSSALARVGGSAGPRWWQVSPSHWAVLFTLLTAFDLAKGHYGMALFSALLAGVDWVWVARAVKTRRAVATAPAQEALDEADAEISRILEAAEQYDNDARQHAARVAARPLSIAHDGPTWGPGSLPLDTERSGGQSDVALWRFVNSRPTPRARPTATDLHNLMVESTKEASDNARIEIYNSRVPARLMMSHSNSAHLALMNSVYQYLEPTNQPQWGLPGVA